MHTLVGLTWIWAVPQQMSIYCRYLQPQRMVEQTKSKSTKPRNATTRVTLYVIENGQQSTFLNFKEHKHRISPMLHMLISIKLVIC